MHESVFTPACLQLIIQTSSFPGQRSGLAHRLLPPDSEKYPNAIVRGDEFSPAARELAVFAKGEGQAQKAADPIHSVRHLLDCSNVLSTYRHSNIRYLADDRVSEEDAEDAFGAGKTKITTVRLPFASSVAAKASLRMGVRVRSVETEEQS
jgi:hypothetical protein